MTKWVVCEHCNQRQRASILWLTCVYCGETLDDHPYFGRDDGDTDHEAAEEATGQQVLRTR
jgi:hypothetical protein